MSIGVAGHQIEECGIEQFQNRDRRPARHLVDEGKAGLEGGTTFGSVFSLGRDGECLAEILLMQSLNTTLFSDVAVVALVADYGLNPQIIPERE